MGRETNRSNGGSSHRNTFGTSRGSRLLRLLLAPVGVLFSRDRLEQTLHLKDSVVAISRDAILTLGPKSQIETANPAAIQLFGHTEDELVGTPFYEYVGLERAALDRREDQVFTETSAPLEAWGRRADGKLFPLELHIATIKFGTSHCLVAYCRDLTQQKIWQRKLEYQSTHDLLTNLPNRERMRSLLEQEIAQAKKNDTSLAYMMIGLTRFKAINESLGYACGDDLLRKVARRFELNTSDRVELGRVGGDEFGAVVSSGNPDTLRKTIAALEESLIKPFQLGEASIQMHAALGWAEYPAHGDVPEALMQNADLALNRAKRERRWAVCFEAEQDVSSLRALAVTGALRKSLQAPVAGGLRMVYQPKVAAPDRRPIGVEALVRWEHPDLPHVSTAELISVAENSGLIRALTRWTLAAAIDQSVRWRQYGLELELAVNVSARALCDDGFEEFMREQLSASGLPPRTLTLELTESVLMDDPRKALEALDALSQLGLKISIDDFGTGYSSLAYLSRVPASELKIDRSFINKMHMDKQSLTIVRSTIELAHGLDLRVVAEGVETPQDWETLCKMGCDIGQGYLFAPPLEVDQLLQWMGQRVSATRPGTREPVALSK